MGVSAEMKETGNGDLDALFNAKALHTARHLCTRCNYLRLNCQCKPEEEKAQESEAESTTEGEVGGADSFGLNGTSPHQRTLNLVRDGFPEHALRRMLTALNAATDEDIQKVLGQARDVYEFMRFHKYDDTAAMLNNICMDHGANDFDPPEPELDPENLPEGQTLQFSYAFAPVLAFRR